MRLASQATRLADLEVSSAAAEAAEAATRGRELAALGRLAEVEARLAGAAATAQHEAAAAALAALDGVADQLAAAQVGPLHVFPACKPCCGNPAVLLGSKIWQLLSDCSAGLLTTILARTCRLGHTYMPKCSDC